MDRFAITFWSGRGPPRTRVIPFAVTHYGFVRGIQTSLIISVLLPQLTLWQLETLAADGEGEMLRDVALAIAGNVADLPPRQ